jgi:hypothetical protein
MMLLRAPVLIPLLSCIDGTYINYSGSEYGGECSAATGVSTLLKPESGIAYLAPMAFKYLGSSFYLLCNSRTTGFEQIQHVR